MGKKGDREYYKKTVTPDRLAFVNEYCTNSNNASAAYKKVYSKVIKERGLNDAAIRNRAIKKLKDKTIQQLIKKRIKKMEERYNISTQYLIDELMEMIANCKVDSDRQNLLKSIDILNKMSGVYVHKQEVDIKTEGIVINYIAPDKED